MADIATSLKDFLFPARAPLREAAATGDTAPTDAASQAASARAASNPSGVDMAAEAAKAAARSRPAPMPAAAPVVKKPKPLGTAGKIGAQFMGGQ